MIRRRIAFVAILLSLGLVGCQDDEPQGPGSWNVRIRSSGPPPGAAAVELRGVTIESVGGVGVTSAFGSLLAGQSGSPAAWGAVVVTPNPGEMVFSVQVAELAEGPPHAVVTSAVDGQDEPVAIGTFSVDFSVAR